MFLDLPLGHTTGGPNDVDTQRRILIDGLTAGAAITDPGTIVDLPYRWSDDHWKADPLSWSRKRQESDANGSGARPAGRGGDTRTARSEKPRYQSPADRDAAEAVNWDQQCLVCLGVG